MDATLQESEFTGLSDIEQFSDDDADRILDFADAVSDDKKLAEEVISNTMTMAKNAILKHYSRFVLSESMIKITTDFLTYVHIQGTKYEKIIQALKVYVIIL